MQCMIPDGNQAAADFATAAGHADLARVQRLQVNPSTRPNVFTESNRKPGEADRGGGNCSAAATRHSLSYDDRPIRCAGNIAIDCGSFPTLRYS